MRQIIKNNFLMIKYIYQARPSHLIGTLLNSILSSVVSLYSIVLVGFIVDSIAQSGNFKEIIIILEAFAIVQMTYAGFDAWVTCVVTPKNMQIIHKKMQMEIFERASKIDYACFEDSEFYNKYYIATHQSDTRAIAVLNSFSAMVGNAFGITAFIAFISTVDAFSVIIILINVPISLFFSAKISKVQKEYVIENASKERLANYIQRVFTKKEYSKEIRIFDGLSFLLKNIYIKTSKDIRNLLNKAGRALFRLNTVQSLNSTTSYTIIMGYFAYKVFASLIKIGDFVMLINASQKLMQQTIGLFHVIPEFYEHSAYIESFRSFMEDVPVTEDYADRLHFPTTPSIELKNLSFRYPGAVKNALSDISISIPYPSKIAFVGLNGVGKSTIIKLLLKLYRPSCGQILINGRDYDEYSLRSVRNSISVVFQDFQLYDMSIAENILMRPVMEKTAEVELVKTALKAVGLYEKVMDLPDGLNAILSKEFCSKGTLLSGGEYQRLAIARAYAKNCSIMLLDEPSSALDPVAEQNIIDMVFKISNGRSVILISHKLYNLQNVDKIFLVDNGEIIEAGTHKELLAQKGAYAKLYRAQADRCLAE